MYVLNGKYRILTILTKHILSKEEKRQIKGFSKEKPLDSLPTSEIDCACVIHGDAYEWQYVDRLYHMLNRHLTRPIRMHVFTEESRSVPAPYIKHSLVDWKIGGPKQSWWYKVQLFNSENFQGNLLYLDLDVVITKNIDWVWQLKTRHFWAVKDFKYLWRPTAQEINSSIMWWNTTQYDWVWKNFLELDLKQTMNRFAGDQDYLNSVISQQHRRFFNTDYIKSWRWQCLDGGYDFRRRIWATPNSGTQLTDSTSVLIFHGRPKPHEIIDPIIINNWI